MALTKEEVRELIRDLKNGGDSSSESKYHPLIIDKVAELARNYLIKVAYNNARKDGVRYINGDFYTRFIVDVKDDEVIDRKYVDLPTRMISLPHDKGLRSVTPVKEPGNEYLIVQNGSEATYRGLEVDEFLHPECYIEGEKIYLRHHNKDCTSLAVRMIASIDGLSSDEIIPLPADFEMEFIKLVSEMLEEQKLAQPDNYNDANTDVDG